MIQRPTHFFQFTVFDQEKYFDKTRLKTLEYFRNRNTQWIDDNNIKIIKVNLIDMPQENEKDNEENVWKLKCPFCKCECKPHGHQPRTIENIYEDGGIIVFMLPRCKCQNQLCPEREKRGSRNPPTHTVFPDFIMPYQHYQTTFIDLIAHGRSYFLEYKSMRIEKHLTPETIKAEFSQLDKSNNKGEFSKLKLKMSLLKKNLQNLFLNTGGKLLMLIGLDDKIPDWVKNENAGEFESYWRYILQEFITVDVDESRPKPADQFVTALQKAKDFIFKRCEVLIKQYLSHKKGQADSGDTNSSKVQARIERVKKWVAEARFRLYVINTLLLFGFMRTNATYLGWRKHK